jgi:hypothetical protein
MSVSRYTVVAWFEQEGYLRIGPEWQRLLVGMESISQIIMRKRINPKNNARKRRSISSVGYIKLQENAIVGQVINPVDRLFRFF